MIRDVPLSKRAHSVGWKPRWRPIENESAPDFPTVDEVFEITQKAWAGALDGRSTFAAAALPVDGATRVDPELGWQTILRYQSDAREIGLTWLAYETLVNSGVHDEEMELARWRIR